METGESLTIKPDYSNESVYWFSVSLQGLRPAVFLLVAAAFYLLCLPRKERRKEREKDSRQCPDNTIAQSECTPPAFLLPSLVENSSGKISLENYSLSLVFNIS